MNHEQMIEQIARAICGVNEPNPDEHMLPGTPCWVALLPEARAAHSVMQRAEMEAGKVAELTQALRDAKQALSGQMSSPQAMVASSRAWAIIFHALEKLEADAALAPYPERRSE